MMKVKVIKKTPRPLTITAKQRKSRRWDAWISDDPEIKAGGITAMAAVGRLIRLNPDKFGVTIQAIALQPESNPDNQSKLTE